MGSTTSAKIGVAPERPTRAPRPPEAPQAPEQPETTMERKPQAPGPEAKTSTSPGYTSMARDPSPDPSSEVGENRRQPKPVLRPAGLHVHKHQRHRTLKTKHNQPPRKTPPAPRPFARVGSAELTTSAATIPATAARPASPRSRDESPAASGPSSPTPPLRAARAPA